VIDMANKDQTEFRLGYIAGLRTMLMNINEGDYIIGDDPSSIMIRTMSARTKDRILKSTKLN
jgi:hypothetical protein